MRSLRLMTWMWIATSQVALAQAQEPLATEPQTQLGRRDEGVSHPIARLELDLGKVEQVVTDVVGRHDTGLSCRASGRNRRARRL